VESVLEWIIRYWVAVCVGIIFPFGKWFYGKLKHQDKLTHEVEDLRCKFEKMDGKIDNLCNDQREDRKLIMKQLNDMQQESMNRHMDIKHEIAGVRLEAAVTKAKQDK